MTCSKSICFVFSFVFQRERAWDSLANNNCVFDTRVYNQTRARFAMQSFSPSPFKLRFAYPVRHRYVKSNDRLTWSFSLEQLLGTHWVQSLDTSPQWFAPPFKLVFNQRFFMRTSDCTAFKFYLFSKNSPRIKSKLKKYNVSVKLQHFLLFLLYIHFCFYIKRYSLPEAKFFSGRAVSQDTLVVVLRADILIKMSSLWILQFASLKNDA